MKLIQSNPQCIAP